MLFLIFTWRLISMHIFGNKTSSFLGLNWPENTWKRRTGIHLWKFEIISNFLLNIHIKKSTEHQIYFISFCSLLYNLNKDKLLFLKLFKFSFHFSEGLKVLWDWIIVKIIQYFVLFVNYRSQSKQSKINLFLVYCFKEKNRFDVK